MTGEPTSFWTATAPAPEREPLRGEAAAEVAVLGAAVQQIIAAIMPQAQETA